MLSRDRYLRSGSWCRAPDGGPPRCWLGRSLDPGTDILTQRRSFLLCCRRQQTPAQELPLAITAGCLSAGEIPAWPGLGGAEPDKAGKRPHAETAEGCSYLPDKYLRDWAGDPPLADQRAGTQGGINKNCFRHFLGTQV